MNVVFLSLLACGGGDRGWVGRSDVPSSATDTDPADSATDSGSDTDTANDTPVDTGLPPLEGDPCTRPVPTEALVVRDELSSEADRASAWVCRAGMFSTGGFGVSTFLESRADGLLSGTGGRAWVQASGRLVVYAGPNEVWVEDGAEITIEAEGVVVTTCPAIVFTDGPNDGC